MYQEYQHCAAQYLWDFALLSLAFSSNLTLIPSISTSLLYRLIYYLPTVVLFYDIQLRELSSLTTCVPYCVLYCVLRPRARVLSRFSYRVLFTAFLHRVCVSEPVCSCVYIAFSIASTAFAFLSPCALAFLFTAFSYHVSHGVLYPRVALTPIASPLSNAPLTNVPRPYLFIIIGSSGPIGDSQSFGSLASFFKSVCALPRT